MDAAPGATGAPPEAFGVLLVDERRLPCSRGEGDAEVLAPAAFLTRLVGRRVLGDGERRAMVRRIAATRDEIGLPEHVRSSPSFAPRVLGAIDSGDVPAAFETLVQHVRTLAAFSDALDVRSALPLALTAPARLDDDVLAIDSALLQSDDDAFAWRRLAALAGAAFEPADLGPVRPPAIDTRAVAGVCALLRFAASESDADARAALVAPQSGVAADDAHTLLASAGARATLLDVIARGAVSDAARFAHGLDVLRTAYRTPDARASAVLAAAFGAFPLDDAATRAVLERIAGDFDAARAFADAWEASDLIAEIAAETANALARAPLPHGVDPAAPVADEPRAPVAIRKLSFSASSLNAYAECARKWWFRYVCAAVEDRGSSASFYGIAFHAALEDFHGVHVRFDGVDRDALADFLDYCVVTAFDRHRTRFDAPVEFELQKRRARRTAKRYLAWLLDRARRAPFEVIGCETATDVELGGHRFIGYIDRLDRDDRTGTVTVVDYKTGAIAMSAGEYLADVRAFREFQLPFYYWARTAAGDVVSRLALVPLKDALLEVAPVELEVVTRPRPAGGDRVGEIGVEELERARERMIALASELSAGTLAAFPATDDPDACRYCAYAESCRERPHALEERFAR
ncbi:MAG TPA: PD-(D/E)XK nuclease family protein [Candidatus Elarobacter sp.]|nr:PD-(D/E)XK nuclease family protein [Candidatus Elarobacter sp.]